MTPLAGRTIALCVTGSIASYKAVETARLFVKAGAKVLPLMTNAAQRFVGAVTLAAITGEPVATDMWDPSFPGEMHVTIGTRADAIVIVPATADLLARLAHGRSDDLVTATVLCARGPVLAAPAMHPRMWTHPATEANVAALAQQGRVRLIGPVSGPVASGDSGIGRMEEPVRIVAAVARTLGTGDLSGKRIVVTAGPTYEPIDPVRYLGNRSSGKMGFAIAARSAARGADVTLVSGPVALATPAGVKRIDIESASELGDALDRLLGPNLEGTDALIMAAAVADFRAAETSRTKLKKSTDGGLATLALTRNTDILAVIGERRAARAVRGPLLVGFALETGDDAAVLAYAKDKLARKRVDLIVANAAHQSLGQATNRIAIVSAAGSSPFEEGTKETLSDRILDAIAARM